jgi:hypothetical protein
MADQIEVSSMTADIEAIFDTYRVAMDASFARHEARIDAINTRQREAKGAALLALEDALDRLHAMQRCSR